MGCFTCTATQGPFQRLEAKRLRFIRKVHRNFKDNSYLCQKCFGQFERIYKLKAEQNATNTNVSLSSYGSTTISTSSNNSSRSQSNDTAVRKTTEPNVASSESSLRLLQFNSHSTDSNSSIDSTDRIVQMVPEILSLRDSSRKTTQNPELNIARHGAEAAVQSVLRRKKTREEGNVVSETPTGLRRDVLPRMDEEESLDDFEISSQLGPNDLAHTRPIVKRRREPVVHQYDEIMNIYLSGTSGG